MRPHENLDLSFVMRNVDSRNETDSDALTGIPVDTPGLTDSNQAYLGTRAELSLLDGRWVQRTEANWSSTDIESQDAAVFLAGETSSDRYEVTYQSTFAFTLDAPMVTAHRATFAIDHEYQRFRQRGPVTIFGDPNQTRGLHNTGFVGEYRLDIADDVSLGGSVRHDDNTDFRNVTTYRGSATWFSEKLSNEIFGFAVDPTGATATAVNQDGTSLRDGLELALAATLPRGFVANASYTYLDATERDRASGLRKDEIRRPNHQGSLGVDWRSDNRRWRFGAVATHSGAFEDIAFLPPLFSQTRIQMSSYTLLGASGSYTVNRALEVFARVENALDEHYEELFGYSTAGIAGYAGIRLNFSPD